MSDRYKANGLAGYVDAAHYWKGATHKTYLGGHSEIIE